MEKNFEIPMAVAVAAALCAALSFLFWPHAGATETKSVATDAHTPFAAIYAVDGTWNPVAAAEVFYPGPHSAVPEFVFNVTEQSEIARVERIELDLSCIESIAPAKWNFDDFVRMHYKSLDNR
ncbi:MAG: hypothetical protein LBB38_04740 [Puniceicoccales bacterium]|jgi:hypothetical protein|nr:hypothetical protein [Puniceicoccales bacterium]